MGTKWQINLSIMKYYVCFFKKFRIDLCFHLSILSRFTNLWNSSIPCPLSSPKTEKLCKSASVSSSFLTFGIATYTSNSSSKSSSASISSMMTSSKISSSVSGKAVIVCSRENFDCHDLSHENGSISHNSSGSAFSSRQGSSSSFTVIACTFTKMLASWKQLTMAVLLMLFHDDTSNYNAFNTAVLGSGWSRSKLDYELD